MRSTFRDKANFYGYGGGVAWLLMSLWDRTFFLPRERENLGLAQSKFGLFSSCNNRQGDSRSFFRKMNPPPSLGPLGSWVEVKLIGSEPPPAVGKPLIFFSFFFCANRYFHPILF